MKGMNRYTGRAIRDEIDLPEHLFQSINDLLTTLIGTRLCRRNYGSLVPELIDQPCNDTTRLLIMNASATAIITFEPRIKITQVVVSQFKSKVGYWEIMIIGSYQSFVGSQRYQRTHTIGAAA